MNAAVRVKAMLRAIRGGASAPDGAAAGVARDAERRRRLARAVTDAARVINGKVSKALVGMDPQQQSQINKVSMDLDKACHKDPSLEESDGEDIGVPEVGMVFNNHTEVNRFYRKYARCVGFSVSVRRSSFSQEGTCLYLELMCCKGGRSCYEPKFRKRASSTTNCPAKIRVKLRGDKLLHVELAILDHNHPVSPAMARFLSSYKQLSGPAKSLYLFVLSCDPERPSQLLVVHPRLRPGSLLDSKLTEALNLGRDIASCV